MTEQGQRVAAIWRQEAFAREWAQGDSFGDLLAFSSAQAACIDEDAGELAAYGFVNEEGRDG